MSIYEKLQADMLSARKGFRKGEVLILSTVIGTLSSNAKLIDGKKIVSDEDVIAYLRKHIKGLDEVISIGARHALEDAQNEKEFLSAYLPTQLTAEELYVTFSGRKATGELTSFADAMKWLKTELPGLYDGKVASTVAKEVFN